MKNIEEDNFMTKGKPESLCHNENRAAFWGRPALA